jgi:hypothetical protein
MDSRFRGNDGELGNWQLLTYSLPFSAACSHVRFQGSGHDYSFRGGGEAQFIGAHGRRQDPKTPVEQALMRGLATA